MQTVCPNSKYFNTNRHFKIQLIYSKIVTDEAKKKKMTMK